MEYAIMAIIILSLPVIFMVFDNPMWDVNRRKERNRD
jgi:hypothetical protein